MSRITLSRFILPVALIGGGCAQVDRITPRRYPDAVTMERQFRPNAKAYRTLASEWLSGGQISMCWFGTSLLGMEMYQWGESWVSPEWWKWDVRSSKGHKPAWSLDQTALIAGTTSKEIVRWHEQMASLGVDCISTISGTFAEESFKYAKIEYFPPRHPNGLLYAPPSSSRTAQRALSLWATKTSPPHLQIESFGNGWFYYDGRPSPSDIAVATQQSRHSGRP